MNEGTGNNAAKYPDKQQTEKNRATYSPYKLVATYVPRICQTK